MEASDQLPTATVVVIALVRGVAFALVTALYLLVGGLFGQHLWCVYVGFFLTMALGVKPGKAPHYICSAFAGYCWAFLYMNLGSWLAALLGISVISCVVLAEFLLTASLLFIHLKPLARTKADTIPAIFAAIATVFGSGSVSRIPYCICAVLIGIGMAYGTGWAVSRITRRLHNSESG